MKGNDLAGLITRTCTAMATHTDALRDLDAALGDGDLGITVGAGCQAVAQALEELAPDAGPAVVLRTAGAAFAGANPSTMAALTGGALLAVARTLKGREDVTSADVLPVLTTAMDTIRTKGKAELGDKTIVDAMEAARVELQRQGGVPADPGALVAAVSQAVSDTAQLQSMRGRAAWLGERSKGLADPGSTFFLYLLTELTANA